MLETIAASPRPVPAKAVAQRLGISLGTSYRVLHTLEHAGYVVRLGHGCFGLRRQGHVALPPSSRRASTWCGPSGPPSSASRLEAEEDTYLALFRGRRDRGRGGDRGIEGDCTSEGLEVGFSRVAHATALGKVLLAACPDETIDDYLGQRQLQRLHRRTRSSGAATSRAT